MCFLLFYFPVWRMAAMLPAISQPKWQGWSINPAAQDKFSTVKKSTNNATDFQCQVCSTEKNVRQKRTRDWKQTNCSQGATTIPNQTTNFPVSSSQIYINKCKSIIHINSTITSQQICFNCRYRYDYKHNLCVWNVTRRLPQIILRGVCFN